MQRRFPHDWYSFLSALLLAAWSFPVAGSEADLTTRARQLAARSQLFNLDTATLNRRFGEELRRCEAPEGRYEEANCLLLSGLQKLSAGGLEEGRADLEKSRKILEEIGDPLGSVLLHAAIAEAERTMSNDAGAAEQYQEALAVLRQAAGSTESVSIESFAMFSRLAGMPEGFLEQMAPMANLMKPLLLSLFETMIRDAYASVLMEQNELGDAEAQLQQAIVLSRSLFGLMDGLVHDRLGQLYHRQRRFDEARESYRKALAGAGAMGDVGRRLAVLERLSRLELSAGRFEAALSANQAALELARELGDRSLEALVLSQQTQLYFRWGHVGEARRVLETARRAATDSGDGFAQAMVLVDAAGLALATGAYQEEIAFLEQAVSHLRKLDANREEIKVLMTNTLMQLGEVYELLGLPERRKAIFVEAERIAEAADFREGLAIARLMAQWDLFARGYKTDISSAAESVLQALAGSDELPADAEMIRGFLMASILVAESDERTLSRARSWLVEADPEDMAIGRAVVQIALASLHFRRGRYGEAIKGWQEARRALRRLGHKDLEALALGAMAAAHWQSGRLEEAVRLSREAIELFESMLAGIKVDDLLTAVLGSDRRRLYQLAIEFYARTGKAAEAFSFAEQARARTMLHLLGNQRFDPTGGAQPELIVQANELRARMLEWQGQLSTVGSKEERQRLERGIGDARREHEELMIRIKLANREYASLVSVNPLDVGTLQQEVLDVDMTLIAYFVSADRVLAWVVDREGVEMVPIPITEQELQDVACMADGMSRGGMTRASRGVRVARRMSSCGARDNLDETLYRKLFAPIAPYLAPGDEGSHTLIIVPHDVLHYLPFSALRNPRSGRYLIQDYTLSFAPSASVLPFLADKASPVDGEVLILGNPATELSSLAGAEQEAQAVARLFDAEPFLGQAATESQIRQRQGRIDLLHLAAHGVYRPATPRFSRIALAAGDGNDGSLDPENDGSLEVEEVFGGLDLHGVNLVVLSACQTALGERTRGDEIVSLTRAFLYAGSPAVVSTLWNVDDQASARLMETFYDRFVAGATVAEALREAQLETLHREGYEAPFYWAPFMLTGDPRGRWVRRESVATP